VLWTKKPQLLLPPWRHERRGRGLRRHRERRHVDLPLRNRIASSRPGFDGIAIDELARRTLAVFA